MLKSFVESLEDPERPLLAPNYWLLLKMGMILPKDTMGRAIRLFIPQIGASFVVSQYVELYLTRSDVDEVLTNLKISMLSTVCVAKAYTLLFWEKDWTKVLNYVTAADKYERDSGHEVREGILNKYTKYCRRVTYFYWVLLFTTFLTTIGTPLLFYLSSSTLKEELRNGTALFPHIFSSWMPFDKYTSPGSWVTVAWHIMICIWGASIEAAYDSFIMVVLVFYAGKFELLKERCKELLGCDGKGIPDDVAVAAFREVHGMHIAHLKHMKLLNSMLSPVMFMYMVMCSLMLCASTYQLTSSTNAIQTLLVAEYLIFCIVQLFVFFWHSNDVLIKNHELSQGLFESEWWAASAGQRRSIVLLSGQLHLSHMLTAGPFSNLTMSTFVAILKGAYSYYTLFRE